jgi:hypothetical protein
MSAPLGNIGKVDEIPKVFPIPRRGFRGLPLLRQLLDDTIYLRAGPMAGYFSVPGLLDADG